MTIHVAAPVDSGDGKLLPVGKVDSRIKQLVAELKAAHHQADNDKDESTEADEWHGRRIDAIEQKILAAPLITLANIKDAADILLMKGGPDWDDDGFIHKLCIKIARAVKKLPGE